MLIRNCEKFLKKEDFNVRVSVFKNNPMYYLPDVYYNAWIETIRDSIGEKIVNSTTYYKFIISSISKINGKVVSIRFDEPGKDLVKILKICFPNFVESIRIDIVELKKIHDINTKPHSWIILVPEFEKL